MAGAGQNLAAVLGTGQTKYVAKRKDVSMNGLVREAIDRALADSGSTFDDIDAVVVGKAPDFFEGVMMPELFMADAVGATGKPLIRVHTAGSVGGSTAVVAASLVQSGKYRRVLAMAWEKQSESNAMWALSIPVPFIKPVGAGAGGYFAPHVRSYIRRSGAPTHIGAMVAVKDRLNGAKNPLAHLHQPDITVEKVMESPMLWDPIRFDETCPSSDGACAVVIGNEEAADARCAEGHPVAWIHATALRTEPLQFSGRDQVSPQAGRDAAAALWKAAGITSPIDEIDAAEIYVPFSWFEPMWLENLGFAAEGEGWKLTEAGETAIGGRLPVNPSGGVLSSNPIGASGMIRFAEAAIQVMGKGGDHQVDGARKALGHAYGGGSQYYSMWVVGADKPAAQKVDCVSAVSPRTRPAALPRGGRGPGQGSVAGGIRRRRHRRGPDRALGSSTPKARGTAAAMRSRPSGTRPSPRPRRSSSSSATPTSAATRKPTSGTSSSRRASYQVTAEGVFTYRVNDEGKWWHCAPTGTWTARRRAHESSKRALNAE